MMDEIGEEEFNEVKDWCKDIATQVILEFLMRFYKYYNPDIVDLSGAQFTLKKSVWVYSNSM